MDFEIKKTDQPHSYRRLIPVKAIWKGDPKEVPPIRVASENGELIKQGVFNEAATWQDELLLESYGHPHAERKEGYWLIVENEKLYVSNTTPQPLIFGENK